METANTATTVDTGEGTTAPVQTQTDSVQTFIVGANSVYSGVDALYEGAKQKEAFIGTLKEEKRALEVQLQELQEQLRISNNINNFKEELNKMEQQPIVTEPTSQLTEEKVQELALKALQQQQVNDQKEANLATAMETLNKVFGAEAENKLETKCKELGIPKEVGLSVAKDSPKAFLKMLGLDEPVQVSVDSLMSRGHNTQAIPASAVSQDKLAQLQANPALARNTQYLQELFKEGLKNPATILNSYTPWEA